MVRHEIGVLTGIHITYDCRILWALGFTHNRMRNSWTKLRKRMTWLILLLRDVFCFFLGLDRRGAMEEARRLARNLWQYPGEQ